MLSLLIIEDQPAVREVVAEIAGELSEHVQVTQVGSLEEARAVLVSEEWSGLITDMSLGDGNVLELISKLNEEGVRMPPTILMSGFLTSARMAQALQLGIEHVLAKPFAPDVLLECLEKMLSKHPEAVAPAEKKPRRPVRSADRLLPEMFEMDRRMGLVYRMFDEIPSHHDVSSVCASALNVAVEVVHAKGGFLAFFERNQHKLVMVANQGIDDVEAACSLDDTHFHALIAGEEELIQSSVDDPKGVCWPDLKKPHYIAIPVRLQGISMGVLCLLEPASDE